MTSTPHQPGTAMQNTVRVFNDSPISYDAGVDFITAYWSEEFAEQFPGKWLTEFIHEQRQKGEREYARSSNGIDWWGSSHVHIGCRDGERFVRASGPGSDAVFGRCHGSYSSLSRLDLAATCSFGSPQGEAATALYRGFCELPPAFGQPRGSRLVADSKGGNTCYVGSRTSDVYLRLYDWGVAHGSGAAETTWRFEAELKGSVANDYAALLMSETQRELAAAAMVRTLFTDRRIECPWNSAPNRPMARPRRKTEEEEKLKWLSEQVSPTCRKLIESGYIEACIEALGLASYVSIRPPDTGQDHGSR